MEHVQFEQFALICIDLLERRKCLQATEATSLVQPDEGAQAELVQAEDARHRAVEQSDARSVEVIHRSIHKSLN